MKRNYAMVMLAASLLALTPALFAQKESIPVKSATRAKGYTVLNPTETIVIYKYIHPVHSPKETDKYRPSYFFSTGTTAVLQPLTLLNLKKAFPDNHDFHDALDANFTSDADLARFDSFHKMYKINWLLQHHS